MPPRTAMTYRADTARESESSDGGGGYVTSFVPLLTGVPCMWAPISDAETIFSSQIGTNPTSRVFMPKGVDITEADQITMIRDRRERLVVQGPLRIEGILPRRNHLEVYCTARRPLYTTP